MSELVIGCEVQLPVGQVIAPPYAYDHLGRCATGVRMRVLREASRAEWFAGVVRMGGTPCNVWRYEYFYAVQAD